MMAAKVGKLSPDEIRNCYRYILGREPGPAEVAGWLEQGTTADQLRRVFLASREFRQQAAGTPAWTPAAGQVLVNIRIPKTAGTSLTSILVDLHGERSTAYADDLDLSNLTDMTLADRARLTLIAGHFQHGIGRLFPQRVIYLTVLRSPAERIYSYYRYVRRRTDHPVNVLFADRDVPFGEFLEISLADPTLRREIDNGQVRRLAGDMSAAAFDATPALFRQAMHNLFAPDMIFGVSEHFDDYLRLLVRNGLLPAVVERRENVSPGDEAPLDEALTGTTPYQLDLLAAFTGWDNLLYDAARAWALAQSQAQI